MDQQFNIVKVMEHYKLSQEDLAKVLFPNVKYPKQAFDRILKNEASLDVVQLERLADYVGILVSDLFSVDTWKSTLEDNCLVLLKGGYKVKLNYNGVYISIYKDNELLYKRLSNIPSMTVNEFINYIDNFIKTYENGSN